MTDVAMVGFAHRSSALPVLERVSVPRGEQAALLEAVREAGFPEAVLLSTCSRTEIYAGRPRMHPARLLDVLVSRSGGWSPELRSSAETRTGDAAVEHLFRVTAGLESRMVGEPEIRSQVRAAFRQACAAGMAGGTLVELFSAAMRAGGEVSRRTSLGSQARSLANRAVEIGLSTTAPVGDTRVVVLGTGRMASAAVAHLRHLGHRPVVVARNAEHAARLVRPSQVRELHELTEEICRTDLLICATGAGHALVTADQVAGAVSGRARPLTMVDLSVPRNVDAAVGEIELVRLVDLEGMQADPSTGPEISSAVGQAESLVRDGLRRYRDNVAARRAGPLIAAMRRRVHEECLAALVRQAPPTEHQDLALTAHRLAGRLLHPATMAARAAAVAGDEAALTSIVQSLTTTYDAAVALTSGRDSQPGGLIGRSSGAETRTTIRSAPASTA